MLIGIITFLFFLIVPQAEAAAGRSLTLEELFIGYVSIFMQYMPFLLIMFFSITLGTIVDTLKKYYYNALKIYIKSCAILLIPYFFIIGIGYGVKFYNPNFFTDIDFNNFMNYLTIGWFFLFLPALIAIIISWAYSSSPDLYIKYARLNLKKYKNSYRDKMKIWHSLFLAYESYENSLKCLKDDELIEKIIEDTELKNLKLLTLEIDEKRKDYQSFNKKLRKKLLELEPFETPIQNYEKFKSILKSIKSELITKNIKFDIGQRKKSSKINYIIVLIAFLTAIINLIYYLLNLS